MKAISNLASVFAFMVAGLISQNASAQCDVTTGPTNDCSYGDAVDNITIGTVTATNGGCSGSFTGYTLFTSPVFDITLDVPTSMNAALGGATYSQGLSIWIDLNNNGQYESTEQVYVSSTASLTQTGTITIPSTFPGVVTNTQLHMRVMCTYNTNPGPASACTSNQGGYGETEDYFVILSGGASASNVAASAVTEPLDNDCGDVNDEVWVTVENMTSNVEDTVPVTVNLSGIVTGTYNDTVFNLAGSSTQNLLITTIDTEAGGTLTVEFITGLSDDDATDDTLTVTLNISNATDISMSGTTTVCDGDSSLFTVDNTVGAEVYTWYLDGSMMTTGTTFNTGALSANAQVVVASSNACRQNDTLDITIAPLATASYTSSVVDDVASFTGVAANEDTVYWDFGDGSTGTGLNPQHTYTQNGDYIVCFYAENSCGSTEFCDTVTISTIGIEEFAGGEVRVYPNPTHDDVKVELNGMEGLSGNWVLYNMDGKELKSEQLNISASTTELVISLGSYAIGTYILEITSESGDVFRKELVRN